MLFFRSEEAAVAWCSNKKIPLSPIVDLPTLWRLAKVWYGNRLDPNVRRPRPEEVAGIFASIGLTGEFWDPLAQATNGR